MEVPKVDTSRMRLNAQVQDKEILGLQKSQDDLPPGKTRLSDGRVIDTTNRVFLLQPTSEHPEVLTFGDGKTFYYRDKRGALRKLDVKPPQQGKPNI